VAKKRIDLLLVERGFAESRAMAQALVMARHVKANGSIVGKSSSLVDDTVGISLEGRSPYVSRGGIKLSHALDHFKVQPSGQTCMDVGASTGGFTDCLLQRGASRVYAIDVGYGQLDYRLRKNTRVVIMDRVNAHFSFEMPELADLCTIDVSFISLRLVVPNVVSHLKAGGFVVALVKPQFEAGRDKVGKGGVVRDPMVHGEVLADLVVWSVSQSFRVRGITPSPIEGAEGNREFFILLQTSAKF